MINSYITGSLEGRALDKFKARLKAEPDLREAYALQKEIARALEEKREAELKAFISEGVQSKRPVAMWNKKVQLALATAASIALITMITVLWPKQENVSELANNSQEKKESPMVKPQDSNTIIQKDHLEPRPIDTQTLAIAAPQKKLLAPEPVSEVADDIEKFDNLTEEVEEREEVIEQDPDLSIPDTFAIEEKFLTTSEPLEISKSLDIPSRSDEKSTDEPSDTDEVVLKDEIIASKYIVVSSVNLSYTDFENTSDIAKKSRITTNDVVLESEEQKTAQARSKPSKSLKVEFWKSVVNFKGYKYNGQVLQLYGINSTETITLHELDNRLYIKIDGKFYFLEKNKKYKRLQEVTNKTLLNVFQNE